MDLKRMTRYANLLSILGNPIRLMILKELLRGTRCVNDMQEILNVSQPSVSQHLTVLRESGLVVSHKCGTSRCYHLVKPELAEDLFAWLSSEYKAIDSRELGMCGGRRG